MNRRAFFGLIAAAIGVTQMKRDFGGSICGSFKKLRKNTLILAHGGEVALIKPKADRDVAAILKLKEELGENIRKANKQLKQINKRLIGNREGLNEQAKILRGNIRRSRAAISSATEDGRK